jgi:biopolymer transport protein ExbD
LILALKDLHTATIKWQDQEYENYSVSEQIENWDSNLKPQSNESISINFDEGSNVDNTANVEQLNKILGYNNTKLLRAYNYYYSDCDHKVRPIEYLDLFIAGNKAPEGSSGWFLPSPKELVLITKSDGDVSFHTGSSSLQYQNIQNILETLSNASKMSLNSSMQKYWSSSEGKSPTYYKTLYVNINFGGYVYYLEKNNAYATARAVCAF